MSKVHEDKTRLDFSWLEWERMKPILFNTEMVRAILEDRKKATRRVVKEPYYIRSEDDAEVARVSGLVMRRGQNITDGVPYPDRPYAPGDILYVRETWCNINKPGIEPDYYYLADMKYEEDYDPSEWTWRPSIHMPKEAARLFLRVADVRVERLREITYDGAIREGADRGRALNNFAWIWNHTIKPADLARYGWDANPFVWVIEFERVSKE